MQNGHTIVGAYKRKLNDLTIETDSKGKKDDQHIKIEQYDDDADVDREKPARKRQKSISYPDPEMIDARDDQISAGTIEIEIAFDVDDNEIGKNACSSPKYGDADDNNGESDVDGNCNVKTIKHAIEHDPESGDNVDNDKKHKYDIESDDDVDVNVDVTKKISDIVVAASKKKQLRDMEKNELVTTCKERGLPSSGNKANLVSPSKTFSI